MEKSHKDQVLVEKLRSYRIDVVNSTIKSIYRDTYPYVKKWIISNSGNENDAKDIFQEAMTVLLIKVRETDLILTCSLPNFVSRICKNMWYNVLRNKKKATTIDDFENSKFLVEDESYEMSDKEKKFEMVRDAFNKLGEKCKKLLKNFYYDEMKLDELSKINNTTYDTVKNEKSRCLRKIRKIMNI